MKEYHEVTLPVGYKTYSPDEEIARKAPAVICSIASRTLRLRSKFLKLKKEHEFNSAFKINLKELEVFLHDAMAELPFEKELTSSCVIQVDHAIRNI